MMGLLIKDFKMMKEKKLFFIIMITISVVNVVFYGNTTFAIGFMSFISSLFVLSTIGYDALDNGNAFLFTLPVSRANYVAEKYLLTFLICGGAWLLAIVFGICVGRWKGIVNISDVMPAALIILSAVIVIQAASIPFQLKFGGEMGRIALMGAFGALSAIWIVAVKAVPMLVANVKYSLSRMSIGGLAALAMVVAWILFLISMRVSVKIMKDKEF